LIFSTRKGNGLREYEGRFYCPKPFLAKLEQSWLALEISKRKMDARGAKEATKQSNQVFA